MSAITRKLGLLLAMAVVATPLRAVWHGHSVRTAHDGHIHFHAHDHGEVTEAHAHYHHHGESHDQESEGGCDEGSDHHDGVLDHGESGPMVFWTAPAGTRVDPPPSAPRSAAVAFESVPTTTPLLRGRPPPRARGHHQHLDHVGITVLRL